MTSWGRSDSGVKCSFCGKSQTEVAQVISGPAVYICNECVALCSDIIDETGLVVQQGTAIRSGSARAVADLREVRSQLSELSERVAEIAEQLERIFSARN